MTHTTDAERAHALAEKHGATSYRNRADTSNPAFGFTLGQLEALISEVEQAARRAPSVPTRKQIEQYLYEQGAVTVSRDVAEAAGLARLAGKMQSAPVVTVPQGWKLVPDASNMTDEQAEAICNLVSCCGGGAHEVYEAALAATPQPPEANQWQDIEYTNKDCREAKMVVIERDGSGKPTVWCDPEIASIIKALNSGGVRTVASCSGHEALPGWIELSDGRALMVCKDQNEHKRILRNSFDHDVNGNPIPNAPQPPDARKPLTHEIITETALQAGAAKFYPEKQRVIEQNYVVSAGFLQRFAVALQEQST